MDEILAAYDKWQRKIHRKPRGYRTAERASFQADERVWKLHKKIFATQAHGMAGLTAKARVIEVDDSDDGSAFLCALARDILAMDAAA